MYACVRVFVHLGSRGLLVACMPCTLPMICCAMVTAAMSHVLIGAAPCFSSFLLFPSPASSPPLRLHGLSHSERNKISHYIIQRAGKGAFVLSDKTFADLPQVCICLCVCHRCAWLWQLAVIYLSFGLREVGKLLAG